MESPKARERAAALALLGLPRYATPEEITHAYRRLARLTHPDATGRTDLDAAQRFTAISEAYNRLASEASDASGRSEGAEPATESSAPRPERRAAQSSPWFSPSRPQGRRPPIVAGPVTVTPFTVGRRSADEGSS